MYCCNKCGQEMLDSGHRCAVPKANASSQLYEVRELGEALCDMEKYIPDESSALGEKFKIVVEKYNKVSEHFV